MATPSDKPKLVAQAPDLKAIRLKHLGIQEEKALEKLERIKTWPKKDQEVSTQRTQQKLNQIREEKSKLAK